MNRADFKRLTKERLADAEVLLRNKRYAGAYYLSGYVVECALKACIAKRTRRYDFPQKEFIREVYTHELPKLLKAAGLEAASKAKSLTDPDFEINWNLVIDWSEQDRYIIRDKTRAQDLYSAVSDLNHGVLPWLQLHW